jgi:hypothetical protein
MLADERRAAERQARERHEAEKRQPGLRQLPIRMYQLERRHGGRGRLRNQWRAVDFIGVVVFRCRAVTSEGIVFQRDEAGQRLLRCVRWLKLTGKTSAWYAGACDEPPTEAVRL